MPGFQPRLEWPVLFNDELVNNPYWLQDAQVGARITAITGWDDSLEVRDVREWNPGRDGERADASWLGGRTVTVEGEVVGSSFEDLQVRKRALASVFAPSVGERVFRLPAGTSSSRFRFAERVVDAGVAAYYRLGDSGSASDGGYDARVAAYSPAGYWKLEDAGTESDGGYDALVMSYCTPIVYYKQEETSGSSASDSSGNGYTGTYTNSPTLNAGEGPIEGITDPTVSYASASSQYITKSYVAALSTATPVLWGWFKSSTTGTNKVVVANSDSVALYGCRLMVSSGNVALFTFYDSGGTLRQCTGTTSVCDGNWHFFVGWHDGSVGYISVDGVVEASSTNSFRAQTTKGLYVGATEIVTSPMNGQLGRCGVGSAGATLTARRVMDLYLAGRPSYKAADASGNALHGALVGSPTLLASGPLEGVTDYAIDFDGTNDYVVIPYTAALNPATFTVSGWIMRDVDTGGSEYICNSSVGTTGYYAYIDSSDKFNLRTVAAAGSATRASTTSIAVGTWYHVAGTWDGTNTRIYVNGVLETTGTSALDVNTSAVFRIGSSGVPSLYFNGKLSRLMVEPSVLTDRQIMDDYLAGRPSYKLADSSGNALHAVQVGGVTFGATGALSGDSDAAADFDGSDDRGVVPYDASLNPATFTVGAWIKRDVDTGAVELIFDSRSSTNVGYNLRIDASDKAVLQIGNGATLITAVSTTSIATGTWYLVVGTYDGTYPRMYVNGALEHTGISVTLSANTSQYARIGCLSTSVANLFNGKIDELFIDNTVWTAQQIAELYAEATQTYTDIELTGYERAECKIVEPIIFGELDNPVAQQFQVVLRASDPRIYNDITTTDDGAISSYTGTTATPLAISAPLTTGTTHDFGSLYVDGGAQIVTTNDLTDIQPATWSGYTAANFTLELDAATRDAYFKLPQNAHRLATCDPIAFWRFAETSGTTADNAEGTATYDGTYVNTPTLNQTGPFTDSVSVLMDGTNDHITVPYNAALFPDEWTFEVWAKASSGSQLPLVNWTNGSTTDGWEIIFSTAVVYVYTGTAAPIVLAYTRTASTAWTHIALTYDGTTLTLYVDGTRRMRCRTTIIDPGAGTLYFAREGATYWPGNISSAGLYGRVVSEGEIGDWYNDAAATSLLRRGSGAYIDEVQTWPMLDAAQTIYPLSGLTTPLVTTYRSARL